MIGAIIGDIAGSRYERVNHKSKVFELFDKKCRLTDDSVMSLAVAKAILDCEEDVDSLGKTAISAMQELGRIYKNAGYGGTFIKWLWAEDPQPYNSFGNGSAMRVGPCGFAAKNLDEARLLSAKVTEISHNHPEGMKGAEAIAVAVYLARNGNSKEEIRNYITSNYYEIGFSLDQIRKSYKFDVSCQGSVPVALEAFFEAVDFEDAIRNAISVGGDSDTIAAMAGAVAEAYFGVPEGIIDSAINYLDARQMEILYYFEKRYPSKALDKNGEATRTVFEVLDDSVNKVIPAGTTVEMDGEYPGGAVHAWADHETMQPDFSSFDKEERGRAARERFSKAGMDISKAAKKAGTGLASLAKSARKSMPTQKADLEAEKSPKEPDGYVKKKREMVFQSVESLQQVVNVVNEAAYALNDKNRTIRESAIPEVLAGALGAGVGGIGSFAALYGLGAVGLSAAGITSGLAAAGTVVGGGMVAGVFVLAAPVAALAAGGVGVASHLKNKQLRQEKERLYTEALKKHEAIIKALKEEADADKERLDYLQSLNILLTQAIKDLKKDLGKA